MTGSGNDGIVLVRSQSANIQSNYIARNFRMGTAISDFSDNNTVRNDILNGNGVSEGGGLAVFNGNNNILLDNAANGNFNGILLSILISGTLVQGNTANGNLNTGIAISADGAENVFRNNIAMHNGIIDLSDATAGCATNTWTGNTFLTDQVASKPDGGPGVGCIQ